MLNHSLLNFISVLLRERCTLKTLSLHTHTLRCLSQQHTLQSLSLCCESRLQLVCLPFLHSFLSKFQLSHNCERRYFINFISLEFTCHTQTDTFNFVSMTENSFLRSTLSDYQFSILPH